MEWLASLLSLLRRVGNIRVFVIGSWLASLLSLLRRVGNIRVFVLARHVKTICRHHQLVVVRAEPMGAWALSAYRQQLLDRRVVAVSEVGLPWVRGAETYAVALHELGHILGSCQELRHHTLSAEVGAWYWAVEHALVWTPAMTSRAVSAIRTREGRFGTLHVAVAVAAVLEAIRRREAGKSVSTLQ